MRNANKLEWVMRYKSKKKKKRKKKASRLSFSALREFFKLILVLRKLKEIFFQDLKCDIKLKFFI